MRVIERKGCSDINRLKIIEYYKKSILCQIMSDEVPLLIIEWGYVFRLWLSITMWPRKCSSKGSIGHTITLSAHQHEKQSRESLTSRNLST